MRIAASTLTAAAVVSSSMLGAMALVSSAHAQPPAAKPAGSEKCFGIAKAGHNDCGAGSHSCAGSATMNGDKASFVYLPRGECGKIEGGSLKAS